MNTASSQSGTFRHRVAPRAFEASSIGQVASSSLRRSHGKGTVHGVFGGAINVLLSGGLISLVPEAAERGPLNITLPLQGGLSMSSFGVRVGDQVMMNDSTLELGNRLKISLGSASVYSPKQRFLLPMLGQTEIEANLATVRETALTLGNRGGLGGLLVLDGPGAANEPVGHLNLFASVALQRIAQLEEAVRSEDLKLMRDSVRNLIGLGPGLTPSSDDVLAGLVLMSVLYARNSGFMQSTSRRIAHVVASEARGRTTILSEEYLRQAAEGRGNEPVMRLCMELLTGGQEAVLRETKRVLMIGETSGTDMVLGILLGTRLCIGKRSNLEAN